MVKLIFYHLFLNRKANFERNEPDSEFSFCKIEKYPQNLKNNQFKMIYLYISNEILLAAIVRQTARMLRMRVNIVKIVNVIQQCLDARILADAYRILGLATAIAIV